MSPVAKPIRLLLVTDHTDTCERIASALLSAPAPYRVERLTAAEFQRDGPPPEASVALVDYAPVGVKQAEIIKRLTKVKVAAVAMVEANDVVTLQEVVLAGAAALVATPFVDDSLWEAVGSALQLGAGAVAPDSGQGVRQERDQSRGTIIALFSPKGGSGTSILASNLAALLQPRSPRGTVLVEIGEGSGSQAVLLHLHPERTIGDLLLRYEPGDGDLLSDVLATHSSGLRVLLAQPDTAARIPVDFLEDILDQLQLMFGFVVLDLSATSQPNVMAALRKADAALVILQPELTALHYGRLFINMAHTTLPEVQLNLVLNRSTMPGGVPVDAIRRHLRMPTAIEIPDDPGLVTGSVNLGVPLVISHPRSGVARAIQKLAHDVTQQSTGGLGRRLVNLAQNPFRRRAE